jgi:hypothetical protein
MLRPDLKRPADVQTQLETRFKNQHRDWLAGGGTWPLTIGLNPPTEADAMAALPSARLWAEEWGAWRGPGSVQMETRNWGKLGAHTVPVTIVFDRPADVATFVGAGDRWAKAQQRYAELTGRWPAMAPRASRHFAEMADYSDSDWQRLLEVLGWLEANRGAGLFARQLPIRGVDTKWLEARASLVKALLGLVHILGDGDLFHVWGIRTLPDTMRVLVLCPHLRQMVAGLRDLTVPQAELATWPLRPRRVLITENLQSTLGMPDLEGVVAIVRLGYRLDVLGALPWVEEAEDIVYWGDIDTHGFSMLAIARGRLPKLRSILMDVATVESHRDLVVHDDDGQGLVGSGALTASEQACYVALREGRWGAGARLEQERIGWQYVLGILEPWAEPKTP